MHAVSRFVVFLLLFCLKNPYNEIKKLAEFLNKSLNELQIKALIDFVSFDNLKNEDSLKISFGFLRIYSDDMVFFNQGKIGYWKNHLSEAMSKKIDEMVTHKLSYKRPIQFEPSLKDL